LVIKHFGEVFFDELWVDVKKTFASCTQPMGFGKGKKPQIGRGKTIHERVVVYQRKDKNLSVEIGDEVG